MGKLVYSTDSGKLCPNCHQSLANCQCRDLAKKQVLGDGKVRIQRETKGRKGKGVTLITGLPLDETELKALAKRLKQIAGTGGAVKNGVIEIQGDQREKMKEQLIQLGYDAKVSGG